MVCKRGHSTKMEQKFVLPNGKTRKKCTYIMGYKMKGDQGTRVIFCGDMKDKLPVGYIPLDNTNI